MPPKKSAADSSTSGPSPPDSPVEEKVEKKTDAAAVQKLSAHPTTAIMLKEAVGALDSRKGVSYQAIKGYIKQTYPSVDVDKLKHLLRKALIKGLESGTLVRPASSTVAAGAQGRFRLAPKAKATNSKTENTDPNAEEGPKAARGEEKKPKKAGTTKKKESGKTKSSEDSKPTKKSKEDNQPAASKGPKKPKAKKAQTQDEEENDETADSPKPKAKKTGKSSQTKAAKGGSEAPKAPGKRGKKSVE